MPNPTVRANATALPNSSRRLFLAAGTAAALCASLKGAAALGVDPIFAAIKHHNEAWRAFDDTCSRADNALARNEGREVTEADKAAVEAVNAAEQSAFEDLITLSPVTVPGMRAAINYFTEFETDCIPGATDKFLTALLASPVLGGCAAQARGAANV
jgi:hypothetical protein